MTSAPLALRIATAVVVGDGVTALYLAGLVGLPIALLVAVAVLGAFRPEPMRDRISRVRGLRLVIVVLAAAASLVDLVYLAQSPLDGLVRLLIFLVLYRLYMRRSLRDVRDTAFLSFFMLVAAAPATVGLPYLFVFLTFLVGGTWMLMLYHVLSESERAGLEVPGPGIGRKLLALSLAASVATLVVTALLFFVMPRMRHAVAPLRQQPGRMVTGFSERVDLGSFGTIETDSTVVMRVRVPLTEPPERLVDLRWRGIAFDHFDGRTWSTSSGESSVVRAMAGQFDFDHQRSLEPLLRQEILLEPLGTDVVFGATRVVRLTMRTGSIRVDDAGGIWVPSASARLQYVAYSQLAPPSWDPVLDRADVQRYLQLPPLDPRIAALAREVAAGSRTPREGALRLTRYLVREMRYTLTLTRQTTLDPLEEFLFVRRAGNCEYFAAALAVMLRTLGIPARVVNGFQQGEWNPYGGYFMVRLRDAHSWVEAHVGTGWITLDPSPRGGAEQFTPPSAMSLWLDALRVRWYRYVINWSIDDQVGIALNLHAATRTWRARIRSLSAWPELSGSAAFPVVGGAALVVALVVLFLWRQGDPGRATGSPARLPRFYARALRALARRGLRPEPGETAREFCARAAGALPVCADALARLTRAYEGVRFGGAPLDDPTLAGLDRCLDVLRGAGRA